VTVPRLTVSLRVLIVATAGILTVEGVGMMLHRYGAVDALPLTMGMRMVQIGLLIACGRLSGAPGTLAGPWWGRSLIRAVGRGLVWSAAIGAAAGLAGAALWMWGVDPRALVRIPLPGTMARAVTLLVLGGIVGPVAEELFFRGIVYGALRRWGMLTAIAVTTVVFAALHWIGTGAMPLVPAAGGVLFAAAYEREQHLAVPMTIHVLGNLALFGLSGWR